jgi:hypothetical protein
LEAERQSRRAESSKLKVAPEIGQIAKLSDLNCLNGLTIPTRTASKLQYYFHSNDLNALNAPNEPIEHNDLNDHNEPNEPNHLNLIWNL